MGRPSWFSGNSRPSQGEIMDIALFFRRAFDRLMGREVVDGPPQLCEYGHPVFAGNNRCGYGHHAAVKQ
jgi:hypothetical protein